MQSSPPEAHDFSPDRWGESLRNPTEFYARCVLGFVYLLPSDIREHRHYFTLERRGFGENAFHVMWWLLFNRFHPERFLEIGVYRGQALSLAALLQRKLKIDGSVTGISPFSASGDAVSRYRDDLNYRQDTLMNFDQFSLQSPTLHQGYSTDPGALALIRSERWDCIYIDGNHDYDVVLADWNACAEAVVPGGIIVLDDAGLTTAYRPPAFATAGHPGPSQVAREVDPLEFREILQVGHNRVFQRIEG